MRYVSLWIDDGRVGCGRRQFFVVAEGRKWVTLFYAPLCATIKVTKPGYIKARPIDEKYRKGWMAATIRANAKAFNTGDDGKVHMTQATKAVLRAITGGKR